MYVLTINRRPDYLLVSVEWNFISRRWAVKPVYVSQC